LQKSVSQSLLAVQLAFVAQRLQVLVPPQSTSDSLLSFFRFSQAVAGALPPLLFACPALLPFPPLLLLPFPLPPSPSDSMPANPAVTAFAE
jgi:hypothetical protein